MPRLKYFNNDTQEWEYVIVGGQGPQGIQGEPGVVSATDPIIYNAETQNVSLGSPDYITFDTTPETSSTTPGTIFWDNGEGTPTVVLNSNVNLNLGQENVALCYNGTGSTITNGSVVYISGAQGQRPSITLADADTEATSSKTFGMATEDILDGTEGFVTTFGIVNGINTSSFTDGQALWLSQTAGQVTATKPVPPAHLVFVGYCLKANESSGRIFINPQNGYELDELHDVLITSPAAGELVVRNSANTLWENKTPAEAGLSEVGHTHDDRYYTESETDSLLNTKASLSGATFTGEVNLTTVNANGVNLNRQDSISEGGQINFKRSSDNANSWYIDVYGSTATPDFRILNNSYIPIQSDYSGRVKLENQPAFLIYSATGTCYHPSGWKNMSTLPTSGNVATAVAEYNIGGHWNSSNGRFTAPVAGRYVFFTGGWASYNGAGNRYAMSFTTNTFGTIYISGANTSAADSPVASSPIVLSLAANDYVDFQMFSSVAQTLGGGSHRFYYGGYFLG